VTLAEPGFTPPAVPSPAPPASERLPARDTGQTRRESWWRRHRVSLPLLGLTLVGVGAAMAWNLQGYPGRVNDDEGTYISRAWAMLYEHHLSNYTYFWDHPFLGWASIGAWAWVTDGFAHTSRSLMAGREFMWVVCLITCALLYVLGRRLEMSRIASATAVLLFGVSPICIWYHRLVFLDNLATVWLVAACALAASRRRNLGMVLGSAACFAAATWSKETVAILFPALVWLIAARTPRWARKKYLLVFTVVYIGLAGMWPLLALVKGEMFPGPGHVSMIGEAIYQLASRQSTGSLLKAGSETAAQARMWLRMDPWLGLGGGAAAGCALLVRRFRPFVCLLVIQLLYMIKGGYVPYAFITVMLPFAALLIAGVADLLWRVGTGFGPGSRGTGPAARPWSRLPPGVARWAPRVPVLIAAGIFLCAVAPQWYTSLRDNSSVNGFANQDAAVTWVAQHVPAHDIVVCDDYPWVDIKVRTRATPVSLWQVDNDPSVKKDLLPDGYKDISYLVLEPSSPLMTSALPGRPTLLAALKHSRIVERFGPINVYKVNR
jgi:4-amino-4-deoxy-L-arabinose transferase-like glycosyltransferase